MPALMGFKRVSTGFQHPTMTDFASSRRPAGQPPCIHACSAPPAICTPRTNGDATFKQHIWKRRAACHALRQSAPDRSQRERYALARESLRNQTNAEAANAGLMPRATPAGSSLASDLDHLEVFLACAALGASPVNRHILPARAGRNAFVWQTGFFIVDPAADQAHPASIFHSYAASKSPKNRALLPSVERTRTVGKTAWESARKTAWP